MAKQVLANSSVNYESVDGGGTAVIRIGDTRLSSYDAARLGAADAAVADARFRGEVTTALAAAGYPAAADPAGINKPLVVMILTVLVLYVTMVYGPIAAALVELFPTRIRYTAMSFPYHVGNGWFGGLLPTAAFAIVAQTGNIYSGLWYPVVVALLTAVIGFFFIHERRGAPLD